MEKQLQKSLKDFCSRPLFVELPSPSLSTPLSLYLGVFGWVRRSDHSTLPFRCLSFCVCVFHFECARAAVFFWQHGSPTQVVHYYYLLPTFSRHFTAPLRSAPSHPHLYARNPNICMTTFPLIRIVKLDKSGLHIQL